MRPIKLEIEGLQSYTTCETINFDQLSRFGLFGIFGATGSGKSTILDAIMLSLYGKITRAKTNKDFINLKLNQARVNLVFAFKENKREKTFEVERIFKRKKNGEVEQSANLFELSSFGKTQIAEGANKVDAKVKELLGLTDAEFSKCIALPQGEFAGFLKATPSERISIVGNLFDLNDYGTPLWNKATERESQLKRDYDMLIAKMGALEVVDFAELERLEQQIKTSQAELKEVEVEAKKLEKSVRELVDLKDNIKLAERTEVKLNELALQSAAMEEKRKMVELYGKAVSDNQYLSRKIELEEKIAELSEKLQEASNNYATQKAELEEILTTFTQKKKAFKEEQETLKIKKDRTISLRTKEARKLVLEEEKTALVKKIEEIQEDEFAKAKSRELVFQNASELKRKLEDMEGAERELQAEISNFSGDTNALALGQKTEAYNFMDAECRNLESQMFNGSEAGLSAKTEAEQKISKLRGSLEQIDEKLNALISGETVEDFLKKKNNEYFELKAKQIEIGEGSKAKRRLRIENEERLNNISILEEKIKNKKLEASKIKAEIDALFAKEKRAAELREENMGLAIFGELTNSLSIGEECPVCRSKIIQKATPERVDLKPYDEALAKIKSQILLLESKESSVLAEIAGFSSRREEVAQAIKLNEKEEAQIEEQKTKLLAEAGAFSEEGLAEKIDEIKQKIDSVLSWSQEQKFIERQVEDLNKTLSKNVGAVEAYKLALDTLKTIEQKLSARMKNLQDELSGMGLEVELDFSALSAEFTIKKQNYEELREKLEKVRQDIKEYEADLSSRDQELFILRTNKTETKAKLSVVEKELDEIAQLLKANLDGTVEKTLADIEKNLNRSVIEEQILDDTKLKHEIAVSELGQSKMKLEGEMVGVKAEFDKVSESVLEKATALGMTEDELRKLESKRPEFEKAEKEVLLFDKVLAESTANLKVINAKIAGRHFDNAELEVVQNKLAEVNADKNERLKTIGALTESLAEKNRTFEKSRDLQLEIKRAQDKHLVAKNLLANLKGNALLEYVAEEYINDISYMASAKMQYLFDGRYELIYENKEFFVLDNFNGGIKRSVNSLSGGETFVLSLALALSLSDAIIANSNKSMDFFFLDEGFGSLDPDLCNYILASIKKLTGNNLTVGLISHVPELKEQIKNRLIVQKATATRGTTLQTIIEP